MSHESDDYVPAREHLLGFTLAALLTAIPFLAVWLRPLSHELTLSVIAIAAVAQIVVHLRIFLGIRIVASKRGAWISLVFATVLLFIMIGGTLWIMTNLAWRMGH